MASLSSLKNDVFSKEHRRQHYADYVRGMTALDRHHKFINDYVRFYGGGGGGGRPLPAKTDDDVLRESYRFIRSEEDDAEASWEQRLARRYYEKLFREYCIADMALYKLSKIGLRWRTEKEVIAGKGQFTCGAKSCSETTGLHSYEVNFAYTEAGEAKQALVKLRVCPKHAYRLNYRKEKELDRERRREAKEERRRKKRRKAEAPQLSPSSDSGAEGNGAEKSSSREEGSSPEEDIQPNGSSSLKSRREGKGLAREGETAGGDGSKLEDVRRQSTSDDLFKGMFP